MIHTKVSIRVARRLLHSCTRAELDPLLREDFANSVYKPRRHPGINKLKIATLPPQLEKSIKIVLEDTSAKSLYEESKKLSDYLRSRLPPPEQTDIDAKAESLFIKCSSKKKVNIETLSDADQEKHMHKEKNKLFNILKKRVYRWANITYDQPTGLQYLMGRSAAEFAVLCRIFEDIQSRNPTFKPRSFFDFGSGVGTGTWAINQYWKADIFEYFVVDTSPAMHDLARLILCNGRDNVELPLKGYFQRQFLPASSRLKYDIVLSAYTLFELPDVKSRIEVIQKLWNKTEHFLIIVEQGTNAGFKLVNEARDFVLNLPEGKNSGYVFSPCPHDKVCPRYMEGETPCNFLMRFYSMAYPSKSELQADLFTYVVLKKGKRPPDDALWPRIVRAPLVRSRHTICRMCTSNGELQEVIFTKRKHDQDTYRCARSSCWGDLLPVKLPIPQPDETPT